MGHQVIWTDEAITDLRRLVEFIAADNPSAAVNLGEKIIRKSMLLAEHPRLGRMLRENRRDTLRELSVPPYRLIYEIDDRSGVVKVRVLWHGARQEPDFGASELRDAAPARAVKQNFTAIAAMSLNRVIGNGNKIPWHLPEDFKWFKAVTMGQILVMGRKTFESIGKPLPGRETIVLTRGAWTHPGVTVVHELGEVLKRVLPCVSPAVAEQMVSAGGTRGSTTVFIAGGAEIYRQALPLCGELLLTLVKREVEGDAFFPPFEDEFELVEKIRETAEFDILRYRRKQATPKTLSAEEQMARFEDSLKESDWGHQPC
jgi:dihydrofolate reductase